MNVKKNLSQPISSPSDYLDKTLIDISINIEEEIGEMSLSLLKESKGLQGEKTTFLKNEGMDINTETEIHTDKVRACLSSENEILEKTILYIDENDQLEKTDPYLLLPNIVGGHDKLEIDYGEHLEKIEVKNGADLIETHVGNKPSSSQFLIKILKICMLLVFFMTGFVYFLKYFIKNIVAF